MREKKYGISVRINRTMIYVYMLWNETLLRIRHSQVSVQAKNIPMPSLWWSVWLVFFSFCKQNIIYRMRSINQVPVCVADFHLWYANLMPCFLLLYTWWENHSILLWASTNIRYALNAVKCIPHLNVASKKLVASSPVKRVLTLNFLDIHIVPDGPHACKLRQHFWNL